MKNFRVWMFAIIIVAFFIGDMLFPAKIFSESENRYLAQKPEYTWEKLISGEYAEDYEEYIGDQFIYRDRWMELKVKTEQGFLKKENNDIIFGKDGYLFNKYIKLPDRFYKNVDLLKNFIKENKEENIFIAIAPNSYQILKDKVPKGLYNVDQEKWIQWMKDELNLKENNFVDLYSSLKKHKDEYIYYKTDHHWTTSGAWYAYETYSKSAGFLPISEDELDPVYIEDFYGTFYSSSPKGKDSQDKIWYYPSLDGKAIIDGEVKDSIYDLKYIEGKDKYALFLHNNPGRVLIKSQESGVLRGKRLLVFKDSYANSMIPFLINHYEEIQVIDLRYYNGRVKDMLEEGWDDILFLFNFSFFSDDSNLLKLKY